MGWLQPIYYDWVVFFLNGPSLCNSELESWDQIIFIPFVFWKRFQFFLLFSISFLCIKVVKVGLMDPLGRRQLNEKRLFAIMPLIKLQVGTWILNKILNILNMTWTRNHTGASQFKTFGMKKRTILEHCILTFRMKKWSTLEYYILRLSGWKREPHRNITF